MSIHVLIHYYLNQNAKRIFSYFPTTFSKRYSPRSRDAVRFILVREEIGWKKGQFQPRDFNTDETIQRLTFYSLMYLRMKIQQFTFSSTIHVFFNNSNHPRVITLQEFLLHVSLYAFRKMEYTLFIIKSIINRKSTRIRNVD